MNVSKSRSLQKLFCKPNKLTKLDVRKNKKLTAKGGIIDADKGVKIIKKVNNIALIDGFRMIL